jgi:lipoprotein-anchoring transpeptidase ErfK/SrfK
VTRWIEVVLSSQTLNAYEGDRLARTFTISSGLPRTPTPTGHYRIWIKLRYDHMSGPGYSLPKVPYVMYFHRGYGIHGTYWHDNFGHPMSHGCVNMRTEDAAWLYDWAQVGTVVQVRE